MNPADPTRWVVNYDGVGPLQLGKPFSAGAPEFSQFSLGTDKYCDSRVRTLKPGTGAAFLYKITLTTRLANDQATAGDYISLGLTQPSGASPILLTDKGIGIGSTEAETRAAYPAGVSKSVFADGTYPYLSVSNGTGHFILFHFGGNDGGPVSSVSVQSFAHDIYEFC